MFDRPKTLKGITAKNYILKSQKIINNDLLAFV